MEQKNICKVDTGVQKQRVNHSTSIDQREWEREQLRLKREKRQHERQQARCSNNIMSVGVRYTESEANMVIDKIKS